MGTAPQAIAFSCTWNLDIRTAAVMRVSSAQGQTETLLYPRSWEAEHYDEATGIELEDSADPTGGRRHLAYIDHGDWVLYRDRNLAGVSHITFRVASDGSGGTISLRESSPAGRLLGKTHVPVTGGWQSFVDVTMAVEAPNAAETSVTPYGSGLGV